MKIFTTKEAARHMQVGQETVRELHKQGLLKGVKFRNGLRISEAAIEEFFLSGATINLPKKKKKQEQPEALRRANEERKRKKQEQHKQQEGQ